MLVQDELPLHHYPILLEVMAQTFRADLIRRGVPIDIANEVIAMTIRNGIHHAIELESCHQHGIVIQFPGGKVLA